MTSEEEKLPKGSGVVVDDFSSFCEGDIEPTLNKKIHSIVDVEDDYIIYVDDDFCVEWSWTEKYGDTPAGFPNIANRLGHLETLSKTSLYKFQREIFAGLLAEGMARIVGDKNEVKATEVLDKAASYLDARSTENARRWYVCGAAIVAFPTLFMAFILWYFKSYVLALLGINAFEIIIGSLLGGVGALFSILSRTEKIRVDPTAGPLIHYVESASRVLVGNVGALIIALAVKANIFLGFTKMTDYSFALLLLICICAGASERLVSGFIKRIKVESFNPTD